MVDLLAYIPDPLIALLLGICFVLFLLRVFMVEGDKARKDKARKDSDGDGSELEILSVFMVEGGDKARKDNDGDGDGSEVESLSDDFDDFDFD